MRLQPYYPPEFLIHSSYSDADYYSLALKLRPAAYLSKEECRQEELINHIRALAAYHGLKAERPNVTKQIKDIAETSKDTGKVLITFCKELLIPEFTSSLGTRFVLLATSKGRTESVSFGVQLPEFDPSYDLVQSLILSEYRGGDPFIFEYAKSAALTKKRGNAVLKSMDKIAFISLASTDNIHLSLGLVQEDPSVRPLAGKAVDLAKLLAHYCKSITFEHLLNILSAQIDARQRELIRVTSQFCLFVGQEELSILDDAAESESWDTTGPYFQKLESLANELRETGTRLLPVAGGDEYAAEYLIHKGLENEYKVAPIVESIWEELKEEFPTQTLHITGDCRVNIPLDDFRIVISRFLQWFIQRFHEVKGECLIYVNLADFEGGSEIIIEDSSRRLSKVLRERLFVPFAQPIFVKQDTNGHQYGRFYLALYLVKVLVEMKYHGIIEDRSDEIQEEVGHRFSIRFP